MNSSTTSVTISPGAAANSISSSNFFWSTTCKGQTAAFPRGASTPTIHKGVNPLPHTGSRFALLPIPTRETRAPLMSDGRALPVQSRQHLYPRLLVVTQRLVLAHVDHLAFARRTPAQGRKGTGFSKSTGPRVQDNIQGSGTTLPSHAAQGHEEKQTCPGKRGRRRRGITTCSALRQPASPAVRPPCPRQG
jgi:hypothetical protein